VGHLIKLTRYRGAAAFPVPNRRFRILVKWLIGTRGVLTLLLINSASTNRSNLWDS